ncbi:MAG: PIN domain-containing protein [Acidimicrobiales bacterium]
MNGWILDKSATSRATEPEVQRTLASLAGSLFVCPVGKLEQLYSARSADDYLRLRQSIDDAFPAVAAPPDAFALALDLQAALARRHGLWHRIPIPDLLIAVTAVHHGLGVVHVDADFERIAQVSPLATLRVG